MTGSRKVTLWSVFGLAIATLGTIGKDALGAGPGGLSLAGWVTVAILVVLLMAVLAANGWFGRDDDSDRE